MTCSKKQHLVPGGAELLTPNLELEALPLRPSPYKVLLEAKMISSVSVSVNVHPNNNKATHERILRKRITWSVAICTGSRFTIYNQISYIYLLYYTYTYKIRYIICYISQLSVHLKKGMELINIYSCSINFILVFKMTMKMCLSVLDIFIS